ncbi:MAG: hypothetical protein ACKO8Z_13565, partial [Prosthecobacter sp.]
MPSAPSDTSTGLLALAPARSTNTPDWFRARSEAAWTEFQSLPLPGLKDENWRYSNAKKIELADHAPAKTPNAEQSKAAIAATEGLNERAARFVF